MNWKEGKEMKRNDWFLVVGILFLASILYVSGITSRKKEAEMLIVKVSGKVFGEYPLSENKSIIINNTNICTIENGEVAMLEATCPDQHCVHQRKISKNRESIICLPNKVVLEIRSQEEAQLDAVSK